MAAFVGPAIQLGATAIGAIAGRPRKKKTINLRALIERYLAMQPGGYVTPADKAAAEATRSRLAGAAGETARGRRIHAQRSVQARGLAGGPADLAAELSIGQDEALARQGAAEQGAAQEYDAYGQNRAYNQGMVSRAFGAEVGAETENARLDSARESEFWNSILGTIPSLGAYFKPSAAPTTAGAALGGALPGATPAPRAPAIQTRVQTPMGSAIRRSPAANYQPRQRTYRTPRLVPAY